GSGVAGMDSNASIKARRGERVPSLRLANGRVSHGTPSEEEIRSPRSLQKEDSIKISIDNVNTCTDSLVTAVDEDGLVSDYISSEMNYKDSRHVSNSTARDGTGEKDDVSLYGTPKEEVGPFLTDAKSSFMKIQLESLFHPSDNKLAMKLFGSKKALMKERIRQRAAGHWIIHPCSKFR
ncbi:uncharacterized protein LOC111084058, partial [Limulus polyphemus]|uniref:Uncharacterized protein LOC111084058 n=1 Tax=Limulus polyphemus TaxID=6850 RepID=A0ABM1RYU1_LIMPO